MRDLAEPEQTGSGPPLLTDWRREDRGSDQSRGIALLRTAILQTHPGRIAVVSSFGAESALLLAIVADIDPYVPVLFLQTGKHFSETLAYRKLLAQHLGLRDVRDITPDAVELEKADPDGTLHRFIPDDCCAVRKVAPLERALASFDAWATGRKRHQSPTRQGLALVEHADGRVKYNPLAAWSAGEIAAELRRRELPLHPLLADGYRSIGCAPCSRPVGAGQDPRAGRWPASPKTECGIHRPVAKSPQPTTSAIPGPRVSQPSREPETMTDLDMLESQSVFILRETYRRLRPAALLWSLGKDSNVLLWLARKAFLGRVPFPVLHVDTGKKFREMYEFRDRYAREWNLNLTVGDCPPVEAIDPTLPPAARSAARKTAGLSAMIETHRLAGVIAGIRRDEQATRAKERVFSPRGAGHTWDVRNQPPEFWDQFTAPLETDAHVRVHPLLSWREIDVWRYIEREQIPVVNLYFARDGKRYRSLGDQDITMPVASQATTIAEIIAELQDTRAPERAGRTMDNETEDAFERLRVAGYL